MTLGDLISALERIDPDFKIEAGIFHSYRGFYNHLAIEPLGRATSVGKFLEEARKAEGETFQGWKGGDFMMSLKTPIWISDQGDSSGRALLDLIVVGDRVEIFSSEIDEYIFGVFS